MNLTLLTTYQYSEEGYTVHAAFTDEAKLKAYLDLYDPKRVKYSLEEVTCFNYDIEQEKPYFQAVITLYGKAECIPCTPDFTPHAYSKPRFNYSQLNSDFEFMTCFKAKSLEEAYKIASYKYTQVMAMGIWPTLTIPTIKDVDSSFQIGKRLKLLSRLQSAFYDRLNEYNDSIQEKLNSVT